MSCLVSDRPPYGWEYYIRHHPGATFFHQSRYLSLLEKFFKLKGYYFYSIDNKGNLTGISPLMACENTLEGYGLVSLPYAVYGGILADNNEIVNDLYQSILGFSQRKSVDFLLLKSTKPLFSENHEPIYFHFKKRLAGNISENWQSIHRKKRADIRKAKQSGLVLSIHQCINVFYEQYAMSLHRLGTPILNRHYFEALMSELGNDVKIFSAIYQEKIIASVLVFFFKKEIIPYYAGSLGEGRQLHAYDFIYWSLMEYAIQNGFEDFNFGRSRKDTGAFHYKTHWGFQPEPLSYEYFSIQKKEKHWEAHPSNPKWKTAISIWKKLPLTLTMQIGPWIAKRLV